MARCSLSDLELVTRLYELRKYYKASVATQTVLDQASDLLFQGQTGEARSVLGGLIDLPLLSSQRF